MPEPSIYMVYITLILLAVLITVGFHMLMEIHKPTRYTYLGFKIFFIVIFTLWIHKYLYEKFTKMLGIKDENKGTNEKSNDDSFNEKIITNIFS